MRKLFFVISCIMISFGILSAQDGMKKDETMGNKEMKMEKNDGAMKSGKMMKEKAMYACPHHPEMKSDMPGKCSTCGMEMTMMKSEMKNDGMKKKKMMKEKKM